MVGGVLLGSYFVFVPHWTSVPDEPSSVVTISGIDCLLGNYATVACSHLGGGLAFLLVSFVVGYFVYERAAGYLLAVAGLFGIVGVTIGWDNNLAQLLLVSAVLLAVGALVTKLEVVTERLRDGRFGAR